VLHPIDSIRDRLLWYYHYTDFSALGAAVGVAEQQAVNMQRIRTWSQAAAEARGSKTTHI
jgi:hypothetical protein